MKIRTGSERPDISIFAGPSASRAMKASTPFNVKWLGMAKRGDVAKARDNGAEHILLLDGHMVDQYPPSPKEVAEVIADGALVVGAASLGALRAVELMPLGMLGLGWVYNRFAAGDLTAEDELLTVQDVKGASLSVPAINVRYGLEKLAIKGIIGGMTMCSALRSIKSVYFPYRTKSKVEEILLEAGLQRTEVDYILSMHCNIKHKDSMLALKFVMDSLCNGYSGPTMRNTSVTHRAPHGSGSYHLSQTPLLAGITRIADTTGLDVLGLPTVSCVRPGTSDVIWVYSGKGSTMELARLSAVMECVERTSALWDSERTCLASEQELIDRKTRFWPPSLFTEMTVSGYGRMQRIHWVAAQDLCCREVLVPAELVFTGHAPVPEQELAFRCRTSNGLGAGDNFDLALGHALEELIERHIISCAELRSSHGPWLRLSAMARALGVDPGTLSDKFVDNNNEALTIDLRTIPEDRQGLIAAFERADISLAVSYLPNAFNLPAIASACVEEVGFDQVLCTAGFAVDIQPERALERSILELAQSRATDRQGSREDCGLDEKGRHRTAPKGHWLLTPSDTMLNFSDIPRQTSTAIKRCTTYIDHLHNIGMDRIATVWFQGPSNTHVVRGIVPGLETWHSTGGESRIGSSSGLRKELEI